MKKKIWVCLSILLFITGCIPTPEQESIIHKDDGKLDEIISDDSQKEYVVGIDGENNSSGVSLKDAIDAPDTIQLSISNPVYGGYLTVDLDATIHIPDVSKVPVFLVDRYRPNAEQKQKIAEFLSGETVFFETDPIGKERWMNEIKYYQEILKALEDCPYGSQVDYEQLKGEYTNAINRLLEEYQRGSDGNKTLWSGSWSDDTIMLFTENGASIWILTEGKDECMITYDTTAIEEGTPSVIDADEARQMIEHIMDTIGIQHYAITGISAADQFYRDKFSSTSGIDDGSFNIFMLPIYDGIPVNQWGTYYGSDTARQQAKVSYSHTAIKEFLSARIRHGCLSGFTWINPITVLETANENVRLLPFDEIMSIFEKHIFMNIYLDGPDNQRTFQVTDIYLSYRCVAKRDSDLYYLLPVWNFIGCDTSFGEKEGESTQASFLTINAIDGSIINDILGY